MKLTDMSRRAFVSSVALAGAATSVAAMPVLASEATEAPAEPWQTDIFEEAALPVEATEELACDIAVVMPRILLFLFSSTGIVNVLVPFPTIG